MLLTMELMKAHGMSTRLQQIAEDHNIVDECVSKILRNKLAQDPQFNIMLHNIQEIMYDKVPDNQYFRDGRVKKLFLKDGTAVVYVWEDKELKTIIHSPGSTIMTTDEEGGVSLTEYVSRDPNRNKEQR